MSRESGSANDACTPEGRYANYFEIGHNAFEFVFDFGQVYAEQNKVRFHTRIVMGPAYASSLLDVLQRAIDRYIETFGPFPERDHEAPGHAR